MKYEHGNGRRMSSIVKAIDRTYQWGAERGWDTLYWAVDLHGTALVADYQDDGISRTFYPYAKEVLQLLTERRDSKLIIFTSSKPFTIGRYISYFRENGINFDFINANPEVESTAHGYFEDKFYFNVMLEDKAGFDAEADWQTILDYMKNKEEL